MSKTSQLLAFVHVEKAAGTTFIHILRHNYFLRYIDARPYYKSSDGVFSSHDLSIARKIIPNLSCIAGHSVKPFSNLEKAHNEIQYITILRDPIKRYISQYQYWVERMDKKITFDDFLNLDEVKDFQTKKFDQNGNIDNAIEILDKKLMLVGLVEDFDNFLVLLKKKIRSFDFDIRYVQKNLARNKIKTNNLYDSYKDRILENNKSDIELYNYAKDILAKKYIHEYGNSFDHDVTQFKSINKVTTIPMRKRYIDYLLRKIYLEPITNLIRKKNGLEASGSY